MSVDEVDLLRWPNPLPESWQAGESAPSSGSSSLFVIREGGEARGEVSVALVIHTPLKDTYPASFRDRVLTPSKDAPAQALQLVSELVFRADPTCRRLVTTTDEGAVADIARAEAAGYRYVVDVDLPGTSLSLLAAEPGWVLEESRHIDRVPTR